jgi:diguanylate cyclase (GGDEF)-like protein/PAS domain S-box-containing protein
MQGPVVDILLLLLLILFFGVEQRSRPQLYFRFWFVGWVLVLGSYWVWEFMPVAGWGYLLKNALRYDLLLLGGISFTMSFLATAGRLKERFTRGALVAVPACIAVDLQVLHLLPPRVMQAVVLLLVVVGHGFALGTISRELPRALTRRRTLIFVLCGGLGLTMAVRVALNPDAPVETLVMTEILLFAAVLYAYSRDRATVAGVVGAVGFAAWALFYVASDALQGHAAALRTFYLFWNLPKYCVGFSMILRVFEESQQEYRALYEDFRMLYESHPHPMWIFSPRTQRFLAVNRAAVETHGYTEEELLGMRLENLEVPMDAETEAKAHTVPVPTDGRRARFRCQDGRVLWVNVYERRVAFQGQTARLIMARDVTDLMEFNDEMARRAQHDELTGLPNRALFAERLAAAMAASQGLGQEQGQLAVLAIDIDHFKQINDTYGHAVGDKCLAVVASRLKSRIRQVDTIARIGGEEFMAVVGGLRGSAVALKVAQQLLHAFREPVRLGDCDLQVTISIGVAIYPDHATDATELRRLADQALYRAKREGRDCVRMAGEADRVGFREDVHQP